MKVIKRDETVQLFKFDKIELAIYKAFKSTKIELFNAYGKLIESEDPDPTKITELEAQIADFNSEVNKFVEYIKLVFEKNILNTNKNEISVEDIQDIIQRELIKKNKYDVVENFILYRNKRAEIREKNSELIVEIRKALSASDVQNQNANVDEYSFGGRIGESSRIVCKKIALGHMNRKSRRNHENNEVYIHDLDNWEVGSHNCLSYPHDKSLKNGFKTRQADVRGAGSVNTAMQLIAVTFQLQSLQQFGGVSSTHIDWTMVPFVRKSFRKHYLTEWIKSLDEFYELDILSLTHTELNKWIEKQITQFYITRPYLNDNNIWKFENKKLFDSHIYQCALLDTKRETYQAAEGLYHNLNTLQSRSGNQLPFTSINYGTCTLPEGRMVTKALLEVSIDGLGPHGTTSIFPCGIFQYMKGVNDKPGTPNYDLKRLAIKSTSERIYPNYANCDWSINVNAINSDRKIKKEVLDKLNDDSINRLISLYNNPEIKEFINNLGYIVQDDGQIVIDYSQKPFEIFSTMGCRTANGQDINADVDYFFGVLMKLINTGKIDDNALYSSAQKDGRGNICPATIILPTLAMEARLNAMKVVGENELTTGKIIDEFFKVLNKKIGECKDTLIERFNYIASQSPKSAKFMYENGTMLGYIPEEGIISALKHGTLAIGQLGLAEALIILIGKDHTTEEGLNLAEGIESLFNQKCAEYKKQYKLNFGVYYTPAENLCYTAFKKWKSKYGEYEGVTYYIDDKGNHQEKKFFTNSMHVPVYDDVDVFQKIDIESRLTGYSNAGCITYVEVPAKIINNPDGAETIVDYMMEHDIPYGAINFPKDRCLNPECNYQGEIEGNVCPKCGCKKIEHLGRVTGYLTGSVYDAFNEGKQDEFGKRIDHTDKEIKEED